MSSLLMSDFKDYVSIDVTFVSEDHESMSGQMSTYQDVELKLRPRTLETELGIRGQEGY